MEIPPIPYTCLFCMRGCVLLLFVAVCCWCRQVVLNGVIQAYVSCVLSHLCMCACWGKNSSGDVVFRGSHVVQMLSPISPPAATTIASTLLRTTTAVVLSHSLASFNYQAFLMDPLNRSPAKRSKTAEVVEFISCERTFFPESHLCKLCVIPRSRVLRTVQFFRW